MPRRAIHASANEAAEMAVRCFPRLSPPGAEAEGHRHFEERRVQRVSRRFDPPGRGARTDVEIRLRARAQEGVASSSAARGQKRAVWTSCVRSPKCTRHVRTNESRSSAESQCRAGRVASRRPVPARYGLGTTCVEQPAPVHAGDALGRRLSTL